MSKWDYMDNKVWKSSEVMKELEAIYVQNLKNKDVIKKSALNSGEIEKMTEAVKKLNEEVDKSNILTSKVEDSKDQENSAKDSLLKELEMLANDALDNYDYDFLYMINKAIDEVKEQEN